MKKGYILLSNKKINVKKLISLLFFLSVAITTTFSQKLLSPNGNFVMSFSISTQGEPTYQLKYKDKSVINKSKLGLELVTNEKNAQSNDAGMQQKSANLQSSLYDHFKIADTSRTTFEKHGNLFGEK